MALLVRHEELQLSSSSRCSQGDRTHLAPLLLIKKVHGDDCQWSYGCTCGTKRRASRAHPRGRLHTRTLLLWHPSQARPCGPPQTTSPSPQGRLGEGLSLAGCVLTSGESTHRGEDLGPLQVWGTRQAHRESGAEFRLEDLLCVPGAGQGRGSAPMLFHPSITLQGQLLFHLSRKYVHSACKREPHPRASPRLQSTWPQSLF